MRRQKPTRSSLLLTLLAGCLLTLGTTSASNKHTTDEHETTTTTTTTAATTTSDSSLILDEEDEEAQKDALHSDVVKPKKMEELFCSATIRRDVNWQNTKAGTKSSAPCPEGSHGKQLWECSPDGQWVTENPNSSGCESSWISVRSNSLNHVMKGDDESGLPEYLRNIKVETRRPMVGGDLPKVLTILERSVQAIAEESWAYKHQKLSNSVVFEVMNQIFRNQEIWESWDVLKRKEYASRFIKASEKAMIASAKGMQATPDSNVFWQPSVVVEMSHKLKMSSQPTDYILFPSQAVWHGVNIDSVNVPKEAIVKVSQDETQVMFSSFELIGQQMTPLDVTVPIAGTDQTEIRKRRIVSRIVSASLIRNGKKIHVEKLHQPVRITFYHKESAVRHMSSPTCVWWNHHELKWNPSGCRLHSHNKTMTSCDCSHISHFAVLMDIESKSYSKPKIVIFLDFMVFVIYGLLAVAVIWAFLDIKSQFSMKDVMNKRFKYKYTKSTDTDPHDKVPVPADIALLNKLIQDEVVDVQRQDPKSPLYSISSFR